MLKSAPKNIKKVLDRIFRKVKTFYKAKPKVFYTVSIAFLLIFSGLIIFFTTKIRPNDDIFLLDSNNVAVLGNKNPSFSVNFGKRDSPDTQWVRFEAKASSKNPFEEENRNFFTKIINFVKPKNNYGIEMSLQGVNLSETEKLDLGGKEEVVKTVAEIIGTEDVKTSTELVDSGRIIGEYTEESVSKKTVLNKEVADSVDLEYQILSGVGLKEEIIIRDMDAYAKDCSDNLEECELPLNEFVFDLKLDEGLKLKKGWFTVEGVGTESYYFEDKDGNYVAHFLPNWAIDSAGNKTYDVSLDVKEEEGGNYKVKVIVDINWLFSSDRVYPVRIDPSIVHDDTADFSGGVFNRTESLTGPKIQKVGVTGYDIDANTAGYWKLDETSGSGAYLLDSSGNANHATPTGTTSIAGKIGNGRNFGGNSTSDVVNAGSSSTLKPTSVTVETWIKPNVTDAAFRGVVTNRANSGIASGYLISYGDAAGKIYFRVTTNCSSWGITLASTTTLQTDRWYHVVAVFTSGSGKLYINGVEEASGVASGNICYDANSLRIGGESDAGVYKFSGGIDEVRISNIVRTPAQIAKSYSNSAGKYSGEYISSSLDMGSSVSDATLSWTPSGVATGDGETPYSATGLVAQWDFNGTSGTSAVSGGSCSTSCNGTLTNMTTTGQDAAVGTGWTANNRRWGDGAVMFDGTDDFVSIPSMGTFSKDSSITLEAWVKSNVTDASTHEILSLTGSSGSFVVKIVENNYLFRAQTGKATVGADNADDTIPVTFGNWYHVVGVFDSNQVKLYINGVLKATTNYNNALTSSANTNGWNIGKYIEIGTSYYYWKGVIDSPKVYSRALSTNEILSNYQAGNIQFQYKTSTDGSSWSDWTAYKEGGSLNLDGNNDYVAIGDIASFDSLTAFSTCTWVKHNNIDSDAHIIGKINNITWGGFMFLRDDVGQTSGRTDMYKIYVGQEGVSAPVIEGATNSSVVGKWTHVCATFAANSATGLRLYVNGQEDPNSPVSTVGVTSVDSDSESLTIGRYNPTSSNYFNGNIDNIQFYSRTLSGSEILSNYQSVDGETPYSDTGMLAFWKFNELSGDTAVSEGSCGTTCNGTLTGFGDTTGQDIIMESGWSSQTKRGSNSSLESYDNPYLYSPSEPGLIGYWPMNEASGSGAYIEDKSGIETTFAQGGTVTTSGEYTIHTFTSSGTFTASASGSVEALVVGGGGGGGHGSSAAGAGGGAGGLKEGTYSVPSGSTTITVGTKGAGSTSAASYGGDGGASSIGSIVSVSGGGGGGPSGSYTGHSGGSGGGGSPSSGAGGAGVSGEGNAGGGAIGDPYYRSGGGGGKGSAGTTATSSVVGNGGTGYASTISGSSLYYAGGGGGGSYQGGPATGGSSIGGNGGYVSSINGVAASPANRGSGGGGAHYGGNGGDGSDGVVVIRYPSSLEGGTVYNNGTPTGTTYTSGKSGGARGFSGSNQIDVGGGSSFNLTSTMTIEAWIKLSSYGGTWGSIFNKRSASNNAGYTFELYNNTGGLQASALGASCTLSLSSTLVPLGVWTHVAATYNVPGNAITIYVNGVPQGSAGCTSMVSSSDNAVIGKNIVALSAVDGTIDEVKIYNTVLPVATIKKHHIEGSSNANVIQQQISTGIKVQGIGSERISSKTSIADSNTIGLWHMDEISGSGAYILDSSGYGNHGTPTGTTASSGKIGNTRIFDGSNDSLNVGSAANLDFGNNGAFTFSGWVNPTTLVDYGGFVSKDTAGRNSPYSYMTTITAAGGLRAHNGSAWVEICASGLVVGTWSHIAYAYNGTTISGYINGSLCGSAAFTYTDNAAYDVTIGSWYSPATVYDFNGKIDEVRIDKIARTADEIAESYRLGREQYVNYSVSQTDFSSSELLSAKVAADRPGSYLSMMYGETPFANYQPDINTVGLWHLEETAGSTAYLKDSSGYGNHGTPTGTSTGGGKIGNTRSFDGSNDSINVGSAANLDFGNNGAFTFSGWVNPTTLVDYGGFVSKDTAGRNSPYSYMTVITAAGGLRAYNSSAGWVEICTSGLVVGTWSHIAYAYNGTTIYGYINGSLCGSAAFIYTDNAAYDVTIGSWYTPVTNYDFNGKIDEVRIDKITRTADEIRQAYEVGLRTHNIVVTFGASLVSGNLISNSGDTSFSIDATKYGLPALGSELFVGDKVIVKENYNGTEYAAQGTVATITSSTGAVTVSSWDSGSTFPTGGYTVSADVFKWQNEYIQVKNRIISTQADAVSLLTLKFTDGNEGRNVWIDDIRTSTGYLKTDSGELLGFTGDPQYIQYKSIFSSYDSNVTPYLSAVQIDYTASSSGPIMEQIMRHGKWFSNGQKQNYWWINN
ncbi:MAG: LamG domain-containing protein [Candidatus Dojkabacteria bacterium]